MAMLFNKTLLCVKCERIILTKYTGNKIMENENLRGCQEDPDLIEGHGHFPFACALRSLKCEDNIIWSARAEMQGTWKVMRGPKGITEMKNLYEDFPLYLFC